MLSTPYSPLFSHSVTIILRLFAPILFRSSPVKNRSYYRNRPQGWSCLRGERLTVTIGRRPVSVASFKAGVNLTGVAFPWV